MKKKLQNQEGVTLLELLIYVVMISILALVFVNFTLDVVGTSQKARVLQDAQQNARFGMDRIIRAIREADSVNIGASTFGSHPGVLSLAMDDPSLNPTVFDLSSGILQVTEGAGSPQPLISDQFVISNLTFSDKSVANRSTNITVEMTLTHPNPENSELFDVDVSLRSSANVREQAD